MRKIGIAILQIISAIFLLVGIVYIVAAFTYPGSVSLYRASAVQITQVYTEAIYSAVISIVCFVVVILLQLLVQQSNNKEMKTLIENTRRTNQLLKQLGAALTKRR